MGGATLFFGSLVLATLFASQVQAGWEMLSPEYGALKDLVRRQEPNQGPRIVIDPGNGEFSCRLAQHHDTPADVGFSTDRLLMDRMLQGNGPISSRWSLYRWQRP